MANILLNTTAFNYIPKEAMKVFVELAMKGPVVTLDNKERNVLQKLVKTYDYTVEHALKKLREAGALYIKDNEVHISDKFIQYQEPDTQEGLL